MGASTHFTSSTVQESEEDDAGPGQHQAFRREVETALAERRFLALTVKPRQMTAAAQRLEKDFGITPVSFDALLLLLRHLHRVCDAMTNPPQWDLVLRADAADENSRDWQNLQRLVGRALPGMAEELLARPAPVLLMDTGLLGRYKLVNTWLQQLRDRLPFSPDMQALVLLIAADGQQAGGGDRRHSGARGRRCPGARSHSPWLGVSVPGVPGIVQANDNAQLLSRHNGDADRAFPGCSQHLWAQR